MYNEMYLNNMFDKIINDINLTLSELSECGFTKEDITLLVNDGILKFENGIYSLKEVEPLFKYGRKLLGQKDKITAQKCFLKCFSLNPNHDSVCYEMFIRSIDEKDYITALKCLDVMCKSDNLPHQIDNNLYLFLLSVITDLPDKYKEYVKSLRLEDILIIYNDPRYENKNAQNNIRKTIFAMKFPYALKQLNHLIGNSSRMTSRDLILKTLIIRAVEAERERKKELFTLAVNKDYSGIIHYLQAKEEKTRLSINDISLIKIALEILNIKRTKEIPYPPLLKTADIIVAIKRQDYKQALMLKKEYMTQKEITTKDALTLLLEDICALIDDLTLNEKEDEITQIIKLLNEGQSFEAFDILEKHMQEIGKEEYLFLVVDLIKISILKGDGDFSKARKMLSYLKRNDFELYLAKYIEKFYLSLAYNSFDEAYLYLDIITRGCDLKGDNTLASNLIEIFNIAKSIATSKEFVQALGKN